MKKRLLSVCLALVLSVVMLAPPALALNKDSTISDWAVEEVTEADALGLFSQDTPMDYTASISRGNFFYIAQNYVAIQSHCSPGLFRNLLNRFVLERDEKGNLINPFVDGDDNDAMAYYLGIAQGNGKGECMPNEPITRQEAATIMIRAYQACGGELPEAAAEITFSDEADIQDWARDGASALAVWNVIKGNGKNEFVPNGTCTYEQAILMFLRLYKNAPVSRINGNAKRLFTYEQCMEEVQENMNRELYWVSQPLEGNGVSFVREDLDGVMHPTTWLYFVYRDGGVQLFHLNIEPGVALDNAAFSEDGKTFTCTLTARHDVVDFVLGVVLEAGIYQATVDTESCQSEVIRIGPSPAE